MTDKTPTTQAFLHADELAPDRVVLWCGECDVDLGPVATVAEAIDNWAEHVGGGHQEPPCICVQPAPGQLVNLTPAAARVPHPDCRSPEHY